MSPIQRGFAGPYTECVRAGDKGLQRVGMGAIARKAGSLGAQAPCEQHFSLDRAVSL
jgi:hypothetical protein